MTRTSKCSLPFRLSTKILCIFYFSRARYMSTANHIIGDLIILVISGGKFKLWLTTVVTRSKAWTAFARSNAGIMGSNPTQSMDVYVRLFCVCAVPCAGSGLAMDWSPVQGVIPIVYRIKKLKQRPKSKKRTAEL
jgi:hypothetical protein